MAAKRGKSFSDVLREYRDTRGLTQKELAERAKMGLSTLKKYESDNDDSTPRHSYVRSLADALELDDDTRKEFIELAHKSRLVGIDEPAPVDTDLLVSAEIPSPSLDDAQPHVLSNATHQAFLPVLYNHYRHRPGKLVTSAVSLLAIAGLAVLLVAAVIHWRTDDYDSVVTYTSDMVLCAGATPLCQTATGSAQGSVHMVCWQDAIGITESKNRWFYIQTPDGSEGFVHASAVSQQSTTPYCSKISWMNATAWALSEDGQTTIPVAISNGHDATTWSSQSLLFAYDTWKFGGGHTLAHSASTAQQLWNLYQADGSARTVSSKSPRGSLVFFADGGAGRVGVSLGNGWVEMTQGTDGAQPFPVTHMTIAQVGLTQVGYVPPNLV